MKPFITALRGYFRLWFHKRNLIIVSEHKVKHVTLSSGTQFLGLAVLAASVCWASYSTGKLMAAKSSLKEESQALRELATAHIETAANNAATTSKPQTDKTPEGPQVDAATALSSIDNIKLYARVAFLEKKVNDLQEANATIVQRVRDKTSGHIDALESIIKQTGLNSGELKKAAAKHEAKDAEGGPYIPDDSQGAPEGTSEMFSDLDKFAILQQIVGNLPLASPLKDAEEESPFGHRIDPINGHMAFHPGLDLAGPLGAKVMSTADGKVIAAGRNGAYGNAIDIDHGSGISTRYGHLSTILVHKGQTVHKGDVIGLEGSTGRSTGPHLHYEVRYHDQPMNPKKFLEAGRYAMEE